MLLYNTLFPWGLAHLFCCEMPNNLSPPPQVNQWTAPCESLVNVPSLGANHHSANMGVFPTHKYMTKTFGFLHKH
ncbi:UNVERIFIED_CONTAM: hypothetical protein FKN15_024684 [Acipenser sinensis]